MFMRTRRTNQMPVKDDMGPYGTVRFLWEHNNPLALTVLWDTGCHTVEREFAFELLFRAELQLHTIGERGVSEVLFHLGSYGYLDIGFAAEGRHQYVWLTLSEFDTMELQRFIRQVHAQSLISERVISADLDKHLEHILASS